METVALDSHLGSNNQSLMQTTTPLVLHDQSASAEVLKRATLPMNMEDLNSPSIDTDSRVILDDKPTPKVDTETSAEEEGVTKVAKHQFGSRFNYYRNFYPYEYQVQIKNKLKSNSQKTYSVIKQGLKMRRRENDFRHSTHIAKNKRARDQFNRLTGGSSIFTIPTIGMQEQQQEISEETKHTKETLEATRFLTRSR